MAQRRIGIAYRHYIGMAGLSGCLPNYAGAYATYEDAVDSLVDLHEMGDVLRDVFDRDGYVALDLDTHGNEYAEVVACEENDTLEAHDG